jgi:hypothetical protein
MKTRRQQRGGMNCVRGLCQRITNKVKSYLPIPGFPAYEKPTLDNQPPGIDFYNELAEYLQKFKRRSPKEIQEACNKIRRFIESTDATDDIINDLGAIPYLNKLSITQEEALEIFQQMEILLDMIITSSENDPQEIYFIGDEWSLQEKARIRARTLVPAMTATRGGLENLLPQGAGPGPAGILGEFLGGPQITSYVKGLNPNLRKRRHSVTAEHQLAALEAVATAVPGTNVGTRQHYRPLIKKPNGALTLIRHGNIVHLRRRKTLKIKFV